MSTCLATAFDNSLEVFTEPWAISCKPKNGSLKFLQVNVRGGVKTLRFDGLLREIAGTVFEGQVRQKMPSDLGEFS